MSDELIVVYTTTDSSDAEIVRAALGNEGVPAFIDGEGQAALTGVFPMHVLVPAADAQRARDYIAHHEPGAVVEGESAAADLVEDELEYERLHPNTDVEPEG